jgi:hypothetical protein
MTRFVITANGSERRAQERSAFLWNQDPRHACESRRSYFRGAARRRWIPARAEMARGGLDDSISKRIALGAGGARDHA